MNYKETIEWLFSQLPMYQKIGKAAYKADLNNTIELLNILNNPQNNFKAAHIGGTNGKGSVSHIIASILQESGLKVGLYTSPHLKDYRERIKINGELIPEDFVVDFVTRHKNKFEKINPSFFEMTVALAFDYFSENNVDIAVVEVGMGGRLDSTNLVNPLVTAITNIGYDHTKYLGNTLEKIAKEKAGIIKEKVPVVIGKKQPETIAVFEEIARKKNTKLFFAEDYYDIKILNNLKPDEQHIDIWRDNEIFIENVNSALLAKYQQENIATALKTIDILQPNFNYNISTSNIAEGLEYLKKNTGFSGRWHIIDTNPLTVCDTAHNEDGIKAVVEQIEESTFDHLHFVLGLVNDKDAEKILELLPRNATYYFCKPDIPRGMEAETLQKKGKEAGLEGLYYNSVEKAFSSAYNNARPRDMVFIGGSTFVVAEVI